jgi:putative phosphoribosyl transferase
VFADRTEAGRRLAGRLGHLRAEDPVVVGLPRGGVPVAFEVAQALGAELDVILVRKLGVPFQPELGMGALGEGGVRVLNDEVIRLARVSSEELAAVEARERAELARRADRYRSGRRPVSLAGRVVVVVDDGIATGSTARAACAVTRAAGARRVVLAVPVAPDDWMQRMAGVADELVALDTPRWLSGIGEYYRDFRQVSDEEVVACLDRADARPRPGSPLDAGRDDEVEVDAGGVKLCGRLTVPLGAVGVVVFVHGSGSSRHSPRNRRVARLLNAAGLATLLFDLLTPAEEADRANVFDVDMLAGRLIEVTRWVRREAGVEGLPVAYFGASTGAGAALLAAAEPANDVAAVVSRGGRPDLAGASLPAVRAPTLLIVGGRDPVTLDLNRQALSELRSERRLEIVPGAGHLFEEPGTLDAVAVLARDWLLACLSPAR